VLEHELYKISFYETFYELSGHRLDSVNFICDLGVVLDSKLNFTSHIDSLVAKAYRLLGYIRRIG
jgi:hypothetical protein